jgi:hypothetical protein
MKLDNLSEKILSITDSNHGEGFTITTDKHVYEVGIDPFQSCCESFGCNYLRSEDSPTDFVGSVLEYITTDDSTAIDGDNSEYEDYGTNSMFVTFHTRQGAFQIVCYNSHNGFYSHGAWLSVDGVEVESVSL